MISGTHQRAPTPLRNPGLASLCGAEVAKYHAQPPEVALNSERLRTLVGREGSRPAVNKLRSNSNPLDSRDEKAPFCGPTSCNEETSTPMGTRGT